MLKNICFVPHMMFVLLLLLLPCKEVLAVEVSSLYQGKVEIENQSTANRRKAIKAALSVVMVKVGGTQKILAKPEVRKAINNYNLYLSQYQYETDEQGALYLQAQFNESKVNKVFQSHNLPLWGSLRPQTLIWLVEEDMLSRKVVSSMSSSQLPTVIQKSSQTRGLPVIMPLMDLEDSQNIALSDVWGKFYQPLSQASQRYDAESIVVMRLSNASLVSSEEFQHNKNEQVVVNCGLLCRNEKDKIYYALDWNFVNDKNSMSKQYTGLDKTFLIKEALDDITEQTYEKYALLTSEKQKFTIEVANVNSIETYMEIFRFLDNLSNVRGVTLNEAEGIKRIFTLDIIGSEEAFLQALALNNELQQYIEPFASKNRVEEPMHPVFYWKSND
jgi:hypothetical protein